MTNGDNVIGRPRLAATREDVAAALESTGGIVVRAARALGCSQRSAWYLVRRYDLAPLVATLRAARTAARRNHNGGADEADEARFVRWCVARSPSTPPAELATLATDTDRDVRLRVAWHPNAPPDALATLTTDEDADVRKAAARRKPRGAR